MNERQFEDILQKYPDLIETGLTLAGRQVSVKGKFIDLLFQDSRKQKLIVELKVGTILRKHVAQLMDYEGELLSPDDPTVRIMLVGNRVPPNFRRSLDHHGIEWKELPVEQLRSFLREKDHQDLLSCFNEEQADASAATTKQTRSGTSSPQSDTPKPGDGLSLRSKLLSVLIGKEGTQLSRRDILDLVTTRYPGTNKSSVIPSDYCYNIINKGIPFTFHLSCI
ncbi:MAG: hypothetical protein JWR80_5475 [Bradyrhizobium sp.]|nr:hypothetical protein [Bradyrhizobium sp.]